MQFPTLSVKEERRLPHGSDWSSIREAGRNAEEPGPRPGDLRYAGFYGQRKRTLI
jgi:hypothetical protein